MWSYEEAEEEEGSLTAGLYSPLELSTSNSRDMSGPVPCNPTMAVFKPLHQNTISQSDLSEAAIFNPLKCLVHPKRTPPPPLPLLSHTSPVSIKMLSGFRVKK